MASAAESQELAAAWSAGLAPHMGLPFIAVVVARLVATFVTSVPLDFRIVGTARSTGFAFGFLELIYNRFLSRDAASRVHSGVGEHVPGSLRDPKMAFAIALSGEPSLSPLTATRARLPGSPAPPSSPTPPPPGSSLTPTSPPPPQSA